MRKLRELTTRYSLVDLVEVVSKSLEGSNHSTIEPGETAPPVKPEGEKKFVKLHKTEKHADPDVYGNPSFSGKVKKDTSRAGREPLPGFPPDTGEPYWPPVKEEEEIEEAERPSWAEFRKMQGKAGQDPQARHLPVGHKVAGADHELKKGENIWNVWKGLKDKKAEAESPKAPEFQKADAPAPVKAQTPDTHGPAGAPQPSVSPKAPQWSPTAKPFNMTPVTPEMKAKQIQSPINKEPMNRIPGTTAPPSAMDRVRAVTGRATPPAAAASASPAPTNITGAAQASAGGGTAASGLASVKAPPPSQQPSARDVTSTPLGTPTMPGPTKGGLKGAWDRAMKKEDVELMEHRAAIMGSLIRGLEPELGEAAGVAKLVSKKTDPIIKRPKFDARGNLVLTQHAKQNITQGKKSRKLTGQTYDPAKQKRFGEAKEEELDEARDREMDVFTGFRSDKGKIKGSPTGRNSKTRQAREKAGPNFRPKSAKERYASARRRKEMSRKYPELSEDSLDEWGLVPKGEARKIREKKETVLVSPKGYKGGGKVQRIPKSQYDPKKHSLAEEQLDEKNWIQGAIKKPGALTAAAHRAKKSVGEFAREHKHSGGKVGKRARLALTLKGLNKEETERLDELKPATLTSYIGKRAETLGQSTPERLKTHYGKQGLEGIKRAASRLGGTFETGKPRKFMIPGDESGKTYSAKKKKLYHGEETQLDEGGPTKKHFQMAADAIRAIPDENKRKEHAAAHADLYSKQNPRFNREKFYQAAGLKKHQYGPTKPHQFHGPQEETQLDEVITKSTPVGDVIHDFVHSDNKVFKGDSKKQRIKRALGAYYGKQRGE